MIKIQIPGRETLTIEHIALDYNGTIAFDGALLPGIGERIQALSRLVSVYVLTADTYGTVRAQCDGLGAEIKTFPRAQAALCKQEIVQGLGAHVACVGNGFNDIEMFDLAELSIAVLDGEGMCTKLLPHADVLTRSGVEALDLLLHTDRLRATLRT